jgi:hypothetical protein
VCVYYQADVTQTTETVRQIVLSPLVLYKLILAQLILDIFLLDHDHLTDTEEQARCNNGNPTGVRHVA